jgi:hypothetical protein
MICGSIYKIAFPNGKHYIGLTTTSLEQRTKEHNNCAKRGDTKCLYNALRKYEMVDSVQLIEIDTADTLEELCEKEIGYIIEYNSYYMNNNGYNMTYGGDGLNGYVFTEEDKQKMSEKRKKYFEEHPEAGKEHSERMKKYFEENPEAGKEHSERMKKYFDNPETRLKHSEIKKHIFEENPEARKEASERMKKYYENPEATQKNREAQKKYHEEHPEARERMSEISKQHWSTQEARERMSEAQKKYYENPEATQKNREAQKKYHEEHPEAGKEHSERMKKYFEENPDARRKSSKGQHKPFDVFTKDGTFIKTFTYQFEAKEYLQTEYNITSTFKISEVLAGRRNNSAGFVFKYK